nr:15 kDa protein B-like [Odocoileus virginianus texanus]
MAGTWKALVLVAGLAAVACVAQRSLSYDEIVIQALKFFNQGRRGQRIFGLLESTPPPPDLNSTTIPLNFRIKETVCFLFRYRRRPRQCPFREGGVSRPSISWLPAPVSRTRNSPSLSPPSQRPCLLPPTHRLDCGSFLKKILGFSLWLFLTTNYQSLLEKQYMLTK